MILIRDVHIVESLWPIEVTPNYVELTQGDILPITVNAIYKDGSREEVKEWTSNYNPQGLAYR